MISLRLRLTTLLLCGLALSPSTALAAKDQESTFQDDPLLLSSDPAVVAGTMDKLAALGVDRLRVSVFWKDVAPANVAQTKPAGFNAADPAQYDPKAWDKYDRIVMLAKDRGLRVNFNVTSPAPSWATGSLADRPDLDKNFDPNPAEFGDFVRAVGTRYSGTYVPPVPSPAAAPAASTPPSLLFPRQATTGPTGPAIPAGALPRVGYWTIWNEPNQPGWLTPQWLQDPRGGKELVETAPRIYRSLVDTAYASLLGTGHTEDTILIGETAPKGQPRVTGPTRAIRPARFIRQLYCLDDNLQFLRGTSAEVRGCPVSDQAAKMAADHPALFKATGYAHHPYELLLPPTVKPGAEDFTTANLDDLSDLLRRIYQRYGQKVPGGGRDVPLYLTEYGQQTKPPDKTGVSFATQAAYLNQVEWMTYRNPRVRTLSQFLLNDDGGDIGVSFQSGLRTLAGKDKPALLAYQLPVYLPQRRVKRGSSLRVFGLVRPAANGKAVRVELQLRAKNGSYKRLRTLTASTARGYVDARFTPTSSGVLRLAWRNGSKLVASRQISFAVTPKTKGK